MYIPAYKIKQNKQRQFYLLLSKVIHKYSTCKVDKGCCNPEDVSVSARDRT